MALTTKIEYDGIRLKLDDRHIDLDYPISDAFRLGDKIIVLFDPDSYESKFGQFRNLVALFPDGKLAWTAELPTSESGDRYYQIESKRPLTASSVKSFRTHIDQATGRILRSSFYK